MEYVDLYHEFLEFTQSHGFDMSTPVDMTKKTSVLYTDCSCQVLVNDHLADPYLVVRVKRQGCPLSNILYVVVIEHLLVQIRSDPQIRGLLKASK